jgi:isocitrate dehydrogenase
MMLDYLGWRHAAEIIHAGIQEAIRSKTVTYDLARQISGATELSCSAFGKAIIDKIKNFK